MMENARSVVTPLPMSVEEVSARGWDQVDVVFVSGDGYVDHPSFATALLGRWQVEVLRAATLDAGKVMALVRGG